MEKQGSYKVTSAPGSGSVPRPKAGRQIIDKAQTASLPRGQTRPDQGTPTIMSVLQIVFSGWGSCLVRLGGWGWVFEESMLLWLSNRVLVGCEGGEPLVVLGGELMVVVDASLEL